MRLYHGTSAESGRRILEEGITPLAMRGGTTHHRAPSHFPAVYLTGAMPAIYAFTAIKKTKSNEACIIEVDLDYLDTDKLAPDEDYINLAFTGMRARGSAQVGEAVERELLFTPDLWRESLREVRSVAYNGAIPPEAITGARFFTEETFKRHGINPLACCAGIQVAMTETLFQPSSQIPFQINFPAIWRACKAEQKHRLASIHGLAHWITVNDFARRLASLTGADLDVLRLFAPLHDAARLNDRRDPQHGTRAADLARRLRSSLLKSLDAPRFELLTFALQHHADGLTTENPTVGACWDADRLDLPRVGIHPKPELLSTDAARTIAESVLYPQAGALMC